MKKQFFYAALAIGMMSSCSSNDLPGNQAPEEQLPEEERVAIELGIQAPASSITASTRSTGAVGGTTPETNLWNGQKLYVVAYEKGTSDKVIDSETVTEDNPDGTYIFETLEFQAPKQTTYPIPDNEKNIQILKDASTIKAVYYNPTGNMDFFGYHIDELTGTLEDFTVKDITITGAEDLLGARTKDVNPTNYPNPVKSEDIDAFNTPTPERGFSAWAARRGIQPILDFKHLLTRFTFTVEAAEPSAAEYIWDAGSSAFKKNESEDGTNTSTAVKIEKVTIKEVKTNVDIVLYDGEDQPYVTVREGSPIADLVLKGRNASGSSEDLTPTAAKVYNGSDNLAETNKASFPAEGGTYSTNTPIGESLMIPEIADDIEIYIEVSQYVLDTETVDGSTKTYKTKKGKITLPLERSKVAVSGSGPTGIDKFAAGSSYAINIRVFSFQRIEISAALSNWANGGHLDVDAE